MSPEAPPKHGENLVVPYGVLSRYPLSLPIVVAALWEMYLVQDNNPLVFTLPVKPFLARLGKGYSQAALRELDDVLYDVYRRMRIGYRREWKDGEDMLTLWLTPDVIKRVKSYRATGQEVV
jgi:hypothetical protein